MSNNDAQEPHPRIPRGMVKAERSAMGDTEDTEYDEESAAAAVLSDPDALESRLSEHALHSVSIEGPISADTVVDITSTTLTLGATVAASEQAEIQGNICALANTSTCVKTEGSTKIDGRYVPETLKFEQTYRFDEPVETIEALRAELQDVFGAGISLDAPE